MQNGTNIENNNTFSITTLEDCSIRYVSGYLAHKCLIKFDCSYYLTSLKNNEKLEVTSELLIFWKAYRSSSESELGNLRAPSDEFYFVIFPGRSS